MKRKRILMLAALMTSVTVTAGAMMDGGSGHDGIVLAAEEDAVVMADEAVSIGIEESGGEDSVSADDFADDVQIIVEDIEIADAQMTVEDTGETVAETLIDMADADASDTPAAIASEVDTGVDGVLTWTLNSVGDLTITGTGAMNDYTSASGFPWYTYKERIQTAVIEEGVTSIGAYAFMGYTNLTVVTLPSTLTTIGQDAFNGCSLLTSISLPSGLTTIGTSAFANSSLSRVRIPDGVTELSDAVFSGCKYLTSVTLPEGLTTIGFDAFLDCTSLTSIQIPDTVTEIGSWAFVNTGLTSLRIPQSVTTIRSYAVGYAYGVTVGLKKTNGFTVYGYSGTAGEKYAEEHEMTCILLNLSLCEITLECDSFVYTGERILPTVVVKNGDTVLTEGEDYTVRGADNKNAGTATAIVTGAGDYIDTVYRTFTITKAAQTVTASADASTVATGSTAALSVDGFGEITYSSSDASIADVSENGVVTGKKPGTVTITVTAAGDENHESGSTTLNIKVKLAKGVISSLTNKSGGIVVKWSKITGASGYYLYRRTPSGSYSLIATIDKASTVSYTDTEVAEKNGTGYYYKVVAYSGETVGTGTGEKIVRLTGTSITSALNSASGKIKLTWSKSSKVTGYQIQYSTDKSFDTGSETKKVSGAAKLSKTLSGLTKGETYYVRIRTYRTVNGTTYYSAWSSRTKVKITK